MSSRVFIGIAFGLLSIGSAYALTSAHSLVADAPDLNPPMATPLLPRNAVQAMETRSIQENQGSQPAPVVASLNPEVDSGMKTQADRFDALETSQRPPARVILQQSAEPAPVSPDNKRITKIDELWTIGVFR